MSIVAAGTVRAQVKVASLLAGEVATTLILREHVLARVTAQFVLVVHVSLAEGIDSPFLLPRLEEA